MRLGMGEPSRGADSCTSVWAMLVDFGPSVAGYHRTFCSECWHESPGLCVIQYTRLPHLAEMPWYLSGRAWQNVGVGTELR